MSFPALPGRKGLSYRVGTCGGVKRTGGRGCLWDTLWFNAGSTLSRTLEQSQIIPLWK